MRQRFDSVGLGSKRGEECIAEHLAAFSDEEKGNKRLNTHGFSVKDTTDLRKPKCMENQSTAIPHNNLESNDESNINSSQKITKPN